MASATTAAAPTPARLSLKVETPGAWSYAGDDAAVFEILSAPSQHADRLHKTLAAAINGPAQAIVVAPGDYTVRLFLPNGEVMAERASVAAGARQEVVFELHPSPHEWLGGETVYGTIQALPARDTAPVLDSIARASNEVLDLYVAPSDPARRGALRGPREQESARARRRETLVEAALDAGRSWAEVQRISGATRVPTIAGWRWQTRIDQARTLPVERLPTLDLVRWWTGVPVAPPEPLRIEAHDPHNAKLAATHRGANRAFRDGTLRAFAAIKDPTGAGHYAVFPQGWVRTSRTALGRPASATVLMTVVIDAVLRAPDDPKAAARWRCAPAVDDIATMSLLGFLATGQTAAADALLRRAQDLLFEKTENPVAAAAGAFALLTYSEERNARERPEWRRWIRNLHQFFPHLPDGAVAMAKMYLKFGEETGTDQIEVERLRGFALDAVRRGLPYLSFALATLSEILALLVRDDEAAQRQGPAVAQTRQALALVRQLGRIAAPGEFFTVLRLGEDTT